MPKSGQGRSSSGPDRSGKDRKRNRSPVTLPTHLTVARVCDRTAGYQGPAMLLDSPARAIVGRRRACLAAVHGNRTKCPQRADKVTRELKEGWQAPRERTLTTFCACRSLGEVYQRPWRTPFGGVRSCTNWFF